MSGTHCAVMIFTWPNLQLGDVVFDCEWKSSKSVEAISVQDGWISMFATKHMSHNITSTIRDYVIH